MTPILDNENKLEMFRRRIALLVGGRLQLGKDPQRAAEIQDKIRAKAGRWNGAKEIKKWRSIRK